MIPALLFLAAYRLPGGLAAVVGSIQPLVIIGMCVLLGWGRPHLSQVLWSLLALAGVAMVTLSGPTTVDTLGLVAAAAGAVSMATGLLRPDYGQALVHGFQGDEARWSLLIARRP